MTFVRVEERRCYRRRLDELYRQYGLGEWRMLYCRRINLPPHYGHCQLSIGRYWSAFAIVSHAAVILSATPQLHRSPRLSTLYCRTSARIIPRISRRPKSVATPSTHISKEGTMQLFTAAKCHVMPSWVKHFMKQIKRLRSLLQWRGSVRVYKMADGAYGELQMYVLFCYFA